MLLLGKHTVSSTELLYFLMEHITLSIYEETTVSIL